MAEGTGDFIKTQPVFTEGGFGDLDPNLGLANTGNFHLGDARQVGEIVEGLVGELAQRLLVTLPVDRDSEHPTLDRGHFHHRFFRLLGQSENGVHADLDLIGEQLGIPSALHLYGDHAKIFPGVGSHFLDPGQVPDLLLNLFTDAILHFEGGGTGVGYGNGDQVEVEVREQFHL